MDRPLVSICIPTYNRADLVVRAVQSAIQQTYSNVEILVADDASTDNTVDLLRQIDDDRIVILSKRSNSGMVDNWNYCLRKAKGDWIKFLASDDLLKPTCVEEMLKVCLEEQVKFVCCAREVVDEKGRVSKTSGYAKTNKKIEGVAWAKQFIQRRRNTLGEPTAVMFSRAFVKKIGYFDPKLKQIVDAEYWVRLLQYTDGYFIVNPLCQFTAHDLGNSSQAALHGWFIDDAFYLIDKYTKPNNNPFQLKRMREMYQAAMSTQRTIYYLWRKKRYKTATAFLQRLLHNIKPHEAVIFFVGHIGNVMVKKVVRS